MTPIEYTESVLRTESPNYFINDVPSRIMHGAIGAVTESAELLDAIKKTVFYGKPLDVVNIQEELGDLLYYVFLAIDAVGGNFEQIVTTNRNKLAARFPEKFTEQAALVRNLATERKILETGVDSESTP